MKAFTSERAGDLLAPRPIALDPWSAEPTTAA